MIWLVPRISLNFPPHNCFGLGPVKFHTKVLLIGIVYLSNYWACRDNSTSFIMLPHEFMPMSGFLPNIKETRILKMSIMVHVLLLVGILDIHFSPMVEMDLKSHAHIFPPHSRRILIFTSDGLRADKLFHNTFVRWIPFLKYVF